MNKYRKKLHTHALLVLRCAGYDVRPNSTWRHLCPLLEDMASITGLAENPAGSAAKSRSAIALKILDSTKKSLEQLMVESTQLGNFYRTLSVDRNLSAAAKKPKKAAKKKMRAKHGAKYEYDHPVVMTFYQSAEWRRLRIKVFIRDNRECACCGATRADGVKMNVDHIKPLRFFWDLRLDIDNLQVLCEPCNHGKGNWDRTDWRIKA